MNDMLEFLLEDCQFVDIMCEDIVEEGTMLDSQRIFYGSKTSNELVKTHKMAMRAMNNNNNRDAKKYLTNKTEYFANIMGIKCGRITITSAKTRFGSCSSKGNISYSYRLMLYPEAAREYVVVHELSHVCEMNHSKRFYAIIERYLPDYKERKKLLKNGG